MKHTFPVAALLLLAACSPQVYSIYLDVRQPSPSGMDLAKKSMAVVYMESSAPADSLLDHTLASALGEQLGNDYFGTPEAVSLFHVPQADTVSLELMHSLVMDTGEDVVFLLGSRLSEPVSEGTSEVRGSHSVDSAFVSSFQVPLNLSLYVYDSMGQDEVRSFKGSSTLRTAVYNSGIVPEENLKDLALRQSAVESFPLGERAAERFLSDWKTERFGFYYFEDYNEEEWLGGVEHAANGRFSAAVDQWAPLTKGNSALKRACACYNIAQAFYMMGDLELAYRWLDQARKLENISLADGLQKRIAARLEK